MSMPTGEAAPFFSFCFPFPQGSTVEEKNKELAHIGSPFSKGCHCAIKEVTKVVFL